MSRYYVMPNVPVNTLVIGGKGPYSTAPYDYRLKYGKQIACHKCSNCNKCKKCDKCNKYDRCKKHKPEPFPRRAMMCDQNYQYYDSSEKMFQDKVDRINYETARQERRGLRRPNLRKLPICPKDWYLSSCQFCRGPKGYPALRSRAGD